MWADVGVENHSECWLAEEAEPGCTERSEWNHSLDVASIRAAVK